MTRCPFSLSRLVKVSDTGQVIYQSEQPRLGDADQVGPVFRKPSEVDPMWCPECGGQMKVISFIEPPQTDVIEAVLKHCGLWEARSPRDRPDVPELVPELDAAYSGHSFDGRSEADESHELTYVDIDTFLASFKSSPTRVGMGNLRARYELRADFACTNLPHAL